jgi:hypothetical protein|tara:strand:+ start:3392 stop:3640 length:249 start_codon:yes stop_codon:yes gene_type:complete
MSEVDNVEVEIADTIDPQDSIRKMMDKWGDGDYTGANDEFAVAMGQRADELVSARKEEISTAIFNDQEQQTETETGEGNEDV